MLRTLLAAAAVAALAVPTAASADGRCKPYTYDSTVAGQPVTMVGIAC